MKTLLSTLALTVRVKFDTAHRLVDYAGKCSNLHGHTYHLEVTISRDNPQELVNPHTEMAADFGDLKSLIKKYVLDDYDHAYVASGDRDQFAVVAREANMKVVDLEAPWKPKRSTAEIIAIDIAGRLTGPLVKAGLYLDRIRLWETEGCSVELSK